MKREISQAEKEHLFEEFHKFSVNNDLSFDLDGPLQCQVMKSDGTFRNYPLEAGEFFLTGFRWGTTGDLLWQFQPEEADERYELMETKSKAVDTIFPMFFGAVKDFCRTYEQYEDDTSSKALLTSLIDSLEDTPTSIDVLYDLEVDRLNKNKQAEAVAMKALPQFGIF